MSHYHNSTNQNEAFVKDAEAKSISQDAEVLEIMKDYTQATASEVWNLFVAYHKNVPLTSIRRALSNLCNDGHLMKANKTKLGLYGRPECYYTLINSQTKMF